MNSLDTGFLNTLISLSKRKKGRITLIVTALVLSLFLAPFAFAGIYLFIKTLSYANNPASGWNLHAWGLLGLGGLLGLAGVWTKLIATEPQMQSHKLLRWITILLLTVGTVASAVMLFLAIKEPAFILSVMLAVALILGLFLLISTISILQTNS
jgi:hypothetical protein